LENLPDTTLLLDNQLCFGLYAASRKVIQLYAPLLKRIDLTYTQYITLLVLWEHRVLPVKELGNYLMLDTGTLTPLLKKLEKKGLVTRTRSVEDERSVLVEVTEKGLAIRAEARGFLSSMLSASHLSFQEIIELRELAKRLVKGLNQSDH
jgi:MarR family transcriptional regulator, organic hydroperoxide resistance regulator